MNKIGKRGVNSFILRQCYACGSATTACSHKGNKAYPMWFPNFDDVGNVLCHGCYWFYVKVEFDRERNQKSCLGCGRQRSRCWINNYDETSDRLCQRCWNWLNKIPVTGHRPITDKKRCYCCDSEASQKNKRGVERWFYNYDVEQNMLCYRCYDWLFYSTKVNEARKRTIEFKGRSVGLKYNPRVGVCNWCRAVAGMIDAQTDRFVKTTQRHHEYYEPSNPMAFTIEVCPRCHTKETRRLEQARGIMKVGGRARYVATAG